MSASIQELCRNAKKRMGVTSQDISDGTGIPLSSVNNFFASSSKAPSFYLVCAICRFLGVSVDRALEITGNISPEEELRQVQDEKERELQSTKMKYENEKLKELNAVHAKLDKSRRTVIIILSALCALLALSLVFCLMVDASIRNAGLIQNGKASAAAWLLILLVAVAVGVMGTVLFNALRYGKEKSPFDRG